MSPITGGYIVSRTDKRKPLYFTASLIFGFALLGFIWAKSPIVIALISLTIGFTGNIT